VQARHRTHPLKTLLAVGNPPGAALASVDPGFGALSELYGASNARLLTGAAATESAFKASAGRYDIVQLASHGVLDDANPLYSYVSLAKGAGEDGFLEAREMADLDLHAALVVLSACETARGGFGGGEGLMGMTWALFMAGSPATVASGWKVDEAATSKLMLALHQHLRKGESRATALRSAELEVRADAQYRHPFYWASFVLSGDGF
jgi:CHAT domain-containing protein